MVCFRSERANRSILAGHRDALPLGYVSHRYPSLPEAAVAMPHKQPRSVQVVIFAETDRGREFLLLRRLSSYGGFWQSVTGSLEAEETHLAAAVREVLEETGITINAEDLVDLQLTNTFEIPPQWRNRYAPGVTHNEEACFATKVAKVPVRLDAIEHDDWVWAGFDLAMEMLHWQSSKSALARFEASFDQGEIPASTGKSALRS